VQALEPGQGHYTFFLNAQGRVLADAIVLCRTEDLLVSTEPETRAKVFEHIDKYIIADDVTLEDITEATCEVAIEGPAAQQLLASQGFAVPDAEYQLLEAEGLTVVRASFTGNPGLRLIAPIERKSDLLLKFDSAPEATAADLLAVRLENARPRYGEDITERYIAHETGLMHAISFQKGCYLGQEIVERVRSRGLVHRQLMGIRIDGLSIPAQGENLLAGEKPAGEITSAAWSPVENAVRALAYIRLDARQSQLRTTAGDVAEIV
jgi:aminomethyltransferase